MVVSAGMEVAQPFCSTPYLTGLAERLKRIAATDVTVLFTGESGVGKRVWAQYIHDNSQRKERCFHSVNIASLTETLIESELFGVARGAYTGQSTNRGGHILAANGGTLFLDEIGDLPLQAQAKLLHIFDEQAVIPVGTTRGTPFNIRFIFATKHNLEDMIDNGRFREDLYYRILTERVHLDSLRDHPEDLPTIADHFLSKWSKRQHKRFKMTPDASDSLKAHTWPGNIRELEKTIERAVMAAHSSELTEKDFIIGKNGAHIAPLAEHLESKKAEYIKQVLSRCGGDRELAAKRLGVGINVVQKSLA